MRRRTQRYFSIFYAVSLLALCLCATRPLSAQTVPRETIDERLRRLHPTDSEGEAELRKMFQEAGCKTIDEEVVVRNDPANVICTLPGDPNSLIIVGAHLDHVYEGTGAVDDWSGASLLPSLVQALNGSARKHTFVFVGFTDEEKGLVGSNFYVKHFPKHRLSTIKAMVNLQCLGLSPTKVWAHVADPGLLFDLTRVSRSMLADLQHSDVQEVGNDDTQAFRNEKLPVITIHSLTPETLPILHTAKDNLAAVHLDELYDSYRVIAAYLAYIDTNLN